MENIEQPLLEIIEAIVKSTDSNKKKISKLEKQMKDYSLRIESLENDMNDILNIRNVEYTEIKKELDMINARIEQHNDFFADLFQEQDDQIDLTSYGNDLPTINNNDIKVGDIVYIKDSLGYIEIQSYEVCNIIENTAFIKETKKTGILNYIFSFFNLPSKKTEKLKHLVKA